MQVLPLVTLNPASFVGLEKGSIEKGRDADMLLLKSPRAGLQLEYVFSGGKLLKSAADGWVKKGMFEQ